VRFGLFLFDEERRMGMSGFRASMTLAALLAAAACGGDNTGPETPRAASVSVISGDNQTGFVGITLGEPLVVLVMSDAGDPVPGVTVTFRVTSGSATVTPASAVTDASGKAETRLKLGSSPGLVQVTATVEGTGLITTFQLAAGIPNVPPACQTGAATLPAVNVVSAGLSGSGICLGGGTSGADYTLIAFNGSTVPSGLTSVQVTGRGINLQIIPVVAPMLNQIASTSSTAGTPRAPTGLRAAFDARLRTSAQRVLTPLMPAARQQMRQARARFNAIPSSVTVGQVLRLNVNANEPCDGADFHGGRVVAISNKAIIVADTLNPPNGFTDAQYQSIGVTFDTLVDPLDRTNFGDPSDVDKNSKVVIFYTRAVNELTPAHSSEFIGGFFYERDLFPTTSTPELQAFAGSNVGEMFYMLAPDPNGLINGNVRKTADVQQITIGTVAHEYQHLINAAHRLFITDAEFEEVWLNEGLSHIAEELLFYRVSGFAPRQNLDATRVTSSPAILKAFNEYAAADFTRFEEFLERTPKASPYADDDSLQTRGATWAMLRYLADHRGSSDGDTWSKLVDAPTIGLASLRSVFGTDLTTRIRDWGTSLYTDDQTATSDLRYQQLSWNNRSIYTQAFKVAYPLKITPLTDALTSTLVMQGGGTAVLRLSVTAGAQGSVDWNAPGGPPVSPAVQWTIVRTR